MMSGTSLDGVDLAYCKFSGKQYKIINAETLPYSEAMKKKLVECKDYNAYEFSKFDREYGYYIG